MISIARTWAFCLQEEEEEEEERREKAEEVKKSREKRMEKQKVVKSNQFETNNKAMTIQNMGLLSSFMNATCCCGRSFCLYCEVEGGEVGVGIEEIIFLGLLILSRIAEFVFIEGQENMRRRVILLLVN